MNEKEPVLGILVCGHGSRAKIASEEFKSLADALKARFPHTPVAHGFLEYSAPNIHMALESLVEAGVNKIVAVPGMLFPATHTQNDIPSVLTTFMQKHPGLTIEYGEPLGLQQSMISAFETRILDALGYQDTPTAGELYNTLLVVVGRGTSVTGANAQASHLTRVVCENLGFGWAQTVYSGITFPSVGAGLELCVNLGFKKIVVAPYFLFGGRLIDRIHGYVDKVASEHPEITFSIADHLRDHPCVIDAFCNRIKECLAGPKPTLSPMQDFQQRLAQGEVQVHHHHAEYSPHDTHQQGHTHTHHHAPYKHIGHPQGPRTMINENICCCFMGQFPQWVLDEAQDRPAQPGVPSCKKTRH